MSETELSSKDFFNWNTPAALAESIKNQSGYKCGRYFDSTDEYFYNKDGKTYVIDSANDAINSKSSNSISSGYGAYLNPGCLYDSSSGYSSDVSAF